VLHLIQAILKFSLSDLLQWAKDWWSGVFTFFSRGVWSCS